MMTDEIMMEVHAIKDAMDAKYGNIQAMRGSHGLMTVQQPAPTRAGCFGQQALMHTLGAPASSGRI